MAKKYNKALIQRLFRSLSTAATVLIKRKSRVIQISGQELAYTEMPKTGVKLFINPTHTYIDDLELPNRVAAIKGLWAHETLHQLLTDFSLLERASSCHSNHHAVKILHDIWNILEDTYIERYAYTQLGELYVRCIHYIQALIYKNTPLLEECSPGLPQFMAALVMYKSMGPIKGSFTDPVAEECFYKSLDILDNGANNLNAIERFEASKQIWNIAKPLWEELVEEKAAAEELMKELLDLMKKLGIDPLPDGDTMSGKISIELPEGTMPDDSHKTGKDKTKALGKSKGLYSDKTDTDDKSESGESTGDKSKDSKTDDDKTKEGKNTESASSNEEVDSSESGDSPDEFEEISEGYELSDEDIERIKAEMDSIRKGMKKEKLEKESYRKEDIDLPFDNPEKMTIVNTRIIATEACEDLYKELVSMNSSIIKKTSAMFRDIFLNDAEECEHSKTGRLNVSRLYGGRKTDYIFNKRIEPKNIQDTAVMVAVDESGSMYSDRKFELAKIAAVILSEVCRNNGISFGCIGFTADNHSTGKIYRYSCDHNIYCNFRNKPSEHYALVNIKADNENRDGYSIRYATQLLMKQRNQYKVLIVISDGEPCANSYHSNGIEDTKRAVSETRSKGIPVIGIAIGNSINDAKYIRMYGSDYVPCKDVSALSTTLCRVLRKQVTKYLKGE